MSATALAARSVAAAIRPPLPLVAAISLCGGAAVGIDAAPDAAGLGDGLVAAVATLTSATIIGLVVAALAQDRQQELARIAFRVAGSWIASVAILYFGWLMVA